MRPVCNEATPHACMASMHTVLPPTCKGPLRRPCASHPAPCLSAVVPDLWSAAAAHSSSQSGSGSSGSGGGDTTGLLAAAPAPGPDAAVNVNATDGTSAGALSPYMATPDTVVIILGVAAILLTLTAIGLRLYRSERGCCCGRRVVAQPTAGARCCTSCLLAAQNDVLPLSSKLLAACCRCWVAAACHGTWHSRGR